MNSPKILALLFVSSVWLLALGWLWQAFDWIWHAGSLVDLNGEESGEIAGRRSQFHMSDLTVVVPACNEQADVGATLRSLLKSEGVRLQIIAVNDRSTDGTGAVMAEAARQFACRPVVEDERRGHSLEVIQIDELPKGWLGKPHALARAAALSEAEWLLFTDADVLFAPQALALALHYAERVEADHLVLMPDWTIGTQGEAAMHGALHALSTWSFRPWRVADPRKRDFLGVGAFNLVRRSTYEALGGFEALRMEVLEDLRFGWMVKRAGKRQQMVLGRGLVSVRWSVGAMGVVRNLEKNLFALYRYKTPTAVLACLGLLVQIALPVMALWAGGWARVAGLVILVSIACVYFASRKITRVSPAYVVFYPVAGLIFLWANMRSVGLALMRGGVMWRGTLYSLKELRAHAGSFW